jgi:hypothetical protein
MSDCKCEHSEHSHYGLWFAIWFVWILMITGEGANCSGQRDDQSRQDQQIRDLDARVHSLEYRR